MKSSTVLALAASLLPLAGAWEITWNDADGNNHTKSGTGPSDCIKIDNPKGHLFKIDSQGATDINMLLFTNSACSGDAAGMATDVFSKEASKGLLGFKVVSLSSTATGSGSTATGNSTATGHTATTATETGTTATAKTTSSGHASSTSGSTSAESKSTQTTVVTSAAATTSNTPSGSASVTSSSAASASTSNAAVRVAGSNSDIVKGVVGGIVGLAAWMI
ncbi:uncharacterized protein N7496_005464 [Penicillium cataractarum]|uniref:Uncharacterized protein n=1 Tax=Penicillium cataractarum TaxID=2100454 RepID=A0A9W9VFX7_9EURO|nr:uncharacterized protein N7496_005464 [Penicillium cataractarum]KAJ5378055.1 hypothetical protein N7496_005464 [Penicillium cataractarum]